MTTDPAKAFKPRIDDLAAMEVGSPQAVTALCQLIQDFALTGRAAARDGLVCSGIHLPNSLGRLLPDEEPARIPAFFGSMVIGNINGDNFDQLVSTFVGIIRSIVGERDFRQRGNNFDPQTFKRRLVMFVSLQGFNVLNLRSATTQVSAVRSYALANSILLQVIVENEVPMTLSAVLGIQQAMMRRKSIVIKSSFGTEELILAALKQLEYAAPIEEAV